VPGAGAAGVDVVGEPVAECLALVPLLRKTLKSAAPRASHACGRCLDQPPDPSIRHLPCMHAVVHELAR